MALIVEATTININIAASYIKENKLVAFPTETVYGLGANALNNHAVEKIFKLKKRPTFNPLILHFSSLSKVLEYFYLNEVELKIAKTFWPGPLTLILSKLKKKANDISYLCKGNVDSFGVRVPNNSIALQLIEKSELPLAAPSANLYNYLSPTTANHVSYSFPCSDLLILNCGKTILGLESTVIEVKNNSINILRFGSITQEMLQSTIKLKVTSKLPSNFNSPGLLKKHYSPTTPLRINALEVMSNEALLAFGNTDTIKNNSLKNAKKILNLSKEACLSEAASNLFAMLWMLDIENFQSIAVMPIPNLGVGKAINERLVKAAAK